MKILYISPENTVGTLTTWKQFHNSKGNICDFITFYKTANNFDPGICLNLPFVSVGNIYSTIRSFYYYNKYGAGGEYSIKPGYPPIWNVSNYYEKCFFYFRDWLWKKVINKKLKNFELWDYDIYHFEWGLDFYRDCSFVKKIANLGKPIICTYHGQDLRTRGVLSKMDALANINLTSELDLLSMHPKINYMFLPVFLGRNFSIRKSSNKIRACHSPTNRYYKGSDIIIDICQRLSFKYENFEFVLIENMSNKNVLKIKSSCDIMIDQIGNHGGWGYGMSSVESMRLGLCCLTEMNEECNDFFKGHPFLNINKDTLESKLVELLNQPKIIDEYKDKSLRWVEQKHNVEIVGQKLYNYYNQIL